MIHDTWLLFAFALACAALGAFAGWVWARTAPDGHRGEGAPPSSPAVPSSTLRGTHAGVRFMR